MSTNRIELFLVYEDGVARYAAHARNAADAVATFKERAEGSATKLTATMAQLAPLPDVQRVVNLLHIEVLLNQSQLMQQMAAQQARATAAGLHLPGRRQ